MAGKRSCLLPSGTASAGSPGHRMHDCQDTQVSAGTSHGAPNCAGDLGVADVAVRARDADRGGDDSVGIEVVDDTFPDPVILVYPPKHLILDFDPGPADAEGTNAAVDG